MIDWRREHNECGQITEQNEEYVPLYIVIKSGIMIYTQSGRKKAKSCSHVILFFNQFVSTQISFQDLENVHLFNIM